MQPTYTPYCSAGGAVAASQEKGACHCSPSIHSNSGTKKWPKLTLPPPPPGAIP